ncbi:MAG: class I SAM-dependent methyltransferase [Anaerovoracaceae bacterium]
MSDYKSQTLEYYEKNAEDFITGTIDSDVTNLYEHFERYMKHEQSILDLGCGTGRDSKYFLEKGYSVTAVDGSLQMCNFASNLIGHDVRCLLFADLDYSQCFDGVWACASLLHVAKEDIDDILSKVNKALEKEGILFTCFKYGDFEYEKNGRFFSNYTEKTISNIINEEAGFKILETFITGDVREDKKDERWVNVVAQKLNNILII